MLIDDDRGDEVGRLQCHASVPLAVGDRRLGMLNVASRDWRVLSDAELSLLTTAGALVSLAVERSRLEAATARALAAEERNRLAREIHDTLAQGLAALTMQLEVADSLAGAKAPDDVRDCTRRWSARWCSPARHSTKRDDPCSTFAKRRSKGGRSARRSRQWRRRGGQIAGRSRSTSP